MAVIFPSIASADQLNLQTEIAQLNPAELEAIHFDIEDGHFVPNITFGLKTLKAVGAFTSIPLSIHLLVDNPETWMRDLSDLDELNIHSVVFHVETTLYPKRLLTLGKRYFPRVGIAFNPVTSLLSYQYLIPEVDFLLLMTTEPDYAGERYIDKLTEKIRQAHQLISANAHSQLWVDGDVNEEKITELSLLGITGFVLGRALFGASDLRSKLRKLTNI